MSETSPNSPEELALMKKWVDAWKTAGPLLEKIRRKEIRSVSTVEAMQALAGGFESAAYLNPPRKSSGLIEQQALFRRFYKCSNG